VKPSTNQGPTNPSWGKVGESSIPRFLASRPRLRANTLWQPENIEDQTTIGGGPAHWLNAGLPPKSSEKAGLIAVHLTVPGARFAFQDAQRGGPSFSQALAAKHADLDLGLVQPTPLLGGVVDPQAAPKALAGFLAEVVGERLAAVDVQVVHDHINRKR
jgi:hypothetical protein